MTDARFAERTSPNDPSAALDDVLRTAGEVADRLREAAGAVGRLGERELAMIVGIAEDVRDRTIAPERLASARRRETLAGVRRSTHRGVDLGFDAAAVGIDVAMDFLEAALRRPKTAAPVQPAPPPIQPAGIPVT